MQELGKGRRGLKHEGDAGRIVERADPHTTHVELAVIAKCISKFRMPMQPVIKSKVGEGEGITPPLEVDDTNRHGCQTEHGDRRQNGHYWTRLLGRKCPRTAVWCRSATPHCPCDEQDRAEIQGDTNGWASIDGQSGKGG